MHWHCCVASSKITKVLTEQSTAMHSGGNSVGGSGGGSSGSRGHSHSCVMGLTVPVPNSHSTVAHGSSGFFRSPAISAQFGQHRG